MVFKVFLKNKQKRRKLKFNRLLLHDIRRNIFLNLKADSHLPKIQQKNYLL